MPINERWAVSLTILFVFGLLAFVIATLLGLFIDPSLSMITRASIVGSWCAITSIVSFIVLVRRHAFGS